MGCKRLKGLFYDHPHREQDKHDCATLEKEDGIYRIFTGLCKGLQEGNRREFRFVCELRIFNRRDNIKNEMKRRDENDEKMKKEEEKKQKQDEVNRLERLIKGMDISKQIGLEVTQFKLCFLSHLWS